MLKSVYKALNKLFPSFFYDFFQQDAAVHRIGQLLHSTKNTTLYGLQIIQYLGSKLWNTLLIFNHVAPHQ